MKHPWSPQRFAHGAREAGVSEDVITASNVAARTIKRVNPDLPVILTLEHLGHLTDVSPKLLRAVVDRTVDPYRTFSIAKRPREGRNAAPPRASRTICVPSPPLMQVQRWLAQNVLNEVIPHSASTAFAPRKSLMDAVERHAGCTWLVKLDVRNFFESILERRVYKVFKALGYGALLSFQLARLCTRATYGHSSSNSISFALPHRSLPEGFLPQGAPTSPMLANLTVRELDERLEGLADQFGWTYSRYADDIAFSTDGRSTRREATRVARLVRLEIQRFGLACNESKTTIVPPGARKVLLGVLIDRAEPRLTRAFRNNVETHLYALRHPLIGASAHRRQRGFSSSIGMRLHIAGLIAFAKQVDPNYAQRLYREFNAVDWDA